MDMDMDMDHHCRWSDIVDRCWKNGNDEATFCLQDRTLKRSSDNFASKIQNVQWSDNVGSSDHDRKIALSELRPPLSSMFLLHVHAAGPCFMSMLHVNAACPGSKSMLHIHASCLLSILMLYICSCCTSIRHVRVYATCPCLCCMFMSMPHVHICASCPSCMSMLHVPCCMSMLHVHAHLHAACPGSMSMLHVHVHAACPNCKSMLHVHAAYSCSLLLPVLFCLSSSAWPVLPVLF